MSSRAQRFEIIEDLLSLRRCIARGILDRIAQDPEFDVSKIDAAIRRIDDGTYGYCDDTGEPIGLRRLEARPTATLSLEAQERHERNERVVRDD